MALTADRDVKRKDGKLIAFPVAAGAVIYKGALVMLDGGYLKPAQGQATGDAAGCVFVGYAYEAVDNSAGQNGDEVCRVEQEGTILVDGDGVAADVGKEVYVVDDATISVTASAVAGEENLKCGVLVEVPSAGKNRIKVDNHIGQVAVTA